MKPEDVIVGTRVYYTPISGRPQKFMGTVAEQPWQLGGGTWVTHLANMEPAYGEWCGNPNKTRVLSAALSHLEPVPA